MCQHDTYRRSVTINNIYFFAPKKQGTDTRFMADEAGHIAAGGRRQRPCGCISPNQRFALEKSGKVRGCSHRCAERAARVACFFA